MGDYFWVIKSSDNEQMSSYKFIAKSRAEVEAQRMNFCGWYGEQGDVDIIRIDHNFHELETVHYWHGEVWEHTVRVGKELKYIINKGKKVK